MLTHHRRSVCLSFVSTDLPVWSGIETVATLYQKDQERFHLLLTEPWVRDREPVTENEVGVTTILPVPTPRLLWLEFSPYRVTLTMQGNGKFSYRHLFERGVFGLSRYWLHNEAKQAEPTPQTQQIRLRNYTRNLILEGKPIPSFLQIEYELWSHQMRLGHYLLSLEIHN